MREIYRFARRYYNDYRQSKPYNVKMFNTTLDANITDHWLYRFIVDRNLTKNLDKNKSISLFSVNGDKLAIHLNRSDYKIFFTGENVHVPETHWYKYEDLFLKEKKINLSIGFDYLFDNKYLRFPLWIMYMFDPTDTYEQIREKCSLLNSHNIDFNKRNKFCALICRYDYFGERIKMYQQINQIEEVSCGGNFMHNDDDLFTKFSDDKLAYLEQFRFNLCPENTNSDGYVTEKIFEAIKSGCIPIYWGSNNNPEPEIINHDAVFFVSNNEINEGIINEIKAINNNPKLYNDFARQNRLSADAPEIIYDYFVKLENKILNMLND